MNDNPAGAVKNRLVVDLTGDIVGLIFFRPPSYIGPRPVGGYIGFWGESIGSREWNQIKTHVDWTQSLTKAARKEMRIFSPTEEGYYPFARVPPGVSDVEVTDFIQFCQSFLDLFPRDLQKDKYFELVDHFPDFILPERTLDVIIRLHRLHGPQQQSRQ